MESILKLRQEIRILERIIRNDLQSVVYLENFMKDPLNERDDRKSGIYGLDEMRGDKESDQLHMHVNNRSKFYRSLPFEFDPEIHEVSYTLEEADDGEKILFKRREEFYLDDDISQGERSVIHTLSNHVLAFDIKYYKGSETETLEEWDSSAVEEGNLLPSGLVVTLELQSEDGETVKSELQVNLQPDMGSNVTWQ